MTDTRKGFFPQISIIVPCFNSEITLEETLISINEQSFDNWETLIINDGSKDKTEFIALQWVKKDSRFRYYPKENEGLGKARNFGIQKAKGEFILPLDSDNLVEFDFIEKAINILVNKPEIGVIHGHAQCFGLHNDFWQVEKYNFEKILFKNYIDACAIFRKSLWLEAGGYDDKMPFQGFEDWDLWIKFGTMKVQFLHLQQVTFRYRISSNSMMKKYTPTTYSENINYIYRKYRCFHKQENVFLKIVKKLPRKIFGILRRLR